MKSYIYIITLMVFTACDTNKTDVTAGQSKVGNSDTMKVLNDTVLNKNTDLDDSTYQDNAIYYVVVADTSKDYFTLRQKMFELNKQFRIPVDTMGRYFNKKKNLIALPDDDEDEAYAGEYFPRRFPSESLSLEYLDFYQDAAGEKTIALVTGIFEKQKSADSALTILRKTENKAFTLKAEIYTGCAH